MTTRPSPRTPPARRWRGRSGVSACAGRRLCSCCWPSASRCACGAPSRACPTPTTRMRTRISCRRPSASSATASTRTTSSTRRPTRTCCTSSSRSGSVAARACRTRLPPTPPTSSSSLGSSLRPAGRSPSGCSTWPGQAVRRPPRRASWPRALLGVGFLPVFYSHLALNDVPMLAPICLALYGTAGIDAPGAAGRLPAGRRGARPGLRDQVHRRDRAAADPRRGRRLAVGAPATAASRRSSRAWRSPPSPRWSPSSSSTPTRCWTSPAFREVCSTRPRPPTTRWASSA